MQRMHLFEFNDLPWIPGPIRTTFLELLNALSKTTGLYDVSFAVLSEAIREAGIKRVQALCAGDGGCAVALANKLTDVQVQMSDLNPSVDNFEHALRDSAGNINFISQSVDALDVPRDLSGMRIVINAVHHFQPDGVASLLQDAINKRQPVAFIEPLERSALPILRYLLVAPPACLLMSAGGIWPPSPRRLLWGALLPASTAMMTFDGLVSHLRAYHPEEWQQMVVGLDGHDTFDWDIRTLKGTMGATVAYLVGIPKEGDNDWN